MQGSIQNFGNKVIVIFGWQGKVMRSWPQARSPDVKAAAIIWICVGARALHRHHCAGGAPIIKNRCRHPQIDGGGGAGL